MQRRYTLAHFLLAGVVVLGLTPPMVDINAQAQITFVSDRHSLGRFDIYIMDADGGNPQNLTHNPRSDSFPAWYNPPFAVAPAGKTLTMWGWFKQFVR